MISTPNADVTPSGYFDFSGFSRLALHGPLRDGDATGYAATVGFLPQLELGIALNRQALEVKGDRPNDYDLTANVKGQLVTQQGWRPAVAGGIFNISSAAGKKTYYGALSHTLWDDRINLSAGYLHGEDNGLYGGLELGIVRHLSAVAEYDSKDVNYGIRVAALNNYVRAAVSHVSEGWSLQLGVQLPLSTVERPPAATPLPRPAAPLDAAGAARAIQAHLVDMGLENVSVQVIGGDRPEVQVAYENRTFPHSEVTAIANVLAATAVYAPESTADITVTTLRDHLPIVVTAVPVDEYRRFMAGQLSHEQFARYLSVRYTDSRFNAAPGAPPVAGMAAPGGAASAAPPGGATAGAGVSGLGPAAPTPGVGTLLVAAPQTNSSNGHADLFIRPALATQVANENWALGLAAGVYPQLYVPVARGTAFDASAQIPVGGSFGVANRSGYVPVLNLPGPQLEQLSLHYTWRPNRSFVDRTYVGEFEHAYAGIATELVWQPSDPRWLGRVAWTALHPTVGDYDQHPTTIGDIRYYFPDLNMDARIAGGQYLYGDRGASLGVVRNFGNTQMGIQFLDTDYGKVGMVSFSVPLGPDHVWENPSTFRVRPPDFFSYAQSQNLASRNAIATVAALAGQELEPDDEIEQTLLDRDRLNPAYIRRSLPDFRRIRLFQIERPLASRVFGQPGIPGAPPVAAPASTP